MDAALADAVAKGQLLQALERVASSGSRLGPDSVAFALFHSGFQLSEPLPHHLLAYLARELAEFVECAPEVRWRRPFATAAALVGLRETEDCAEVRSILGSVAALHGGCEGPSRRRSPTRPADIAMAFWGLQWQPCSAEVRALLAALGREARRCEGAPSQHDLALTLFGLSSLSDGEGGQGDAATLDAVLSDLTPLASRCTEAFQPESVGAALYGLRWMTDGPAVRDMLNALAGPVGRCSEGLAGKTVACALVGLNGSRGSPAVRGMLCALTPLLRRSTAPLPPLSIGQAMYGFRWKDPDPAVQSCLAALVPLVAACPEPALPGSIGPALAGLNYQAGCAPGEQLMDIFASQVERCESPASLIQISRATLSLRHLLRSPARDRMRAALAGLSVRSSGAEQPVPDPRSGFHDALRFPGRLGEDSLGAQQLADLDAAISCLRDPCEAVHERRPLSADGRKRYQDITSWPGYGTMWGTREE